MSPWNFSCWSSVFVEPKIGNLRPKGNPPPECHRILGWTANYASTDHFKIPLPLELRVSKSLLVPLRYRIICTNFSQYSSSGDFTLVFRNAMDFQVSDISLLLAYKVFATRLWNSMNFSWSSFLQSSFAEKILLRAALDFVPLPFGSAFVKGGKYLLNVTQNHDPQLTTNSVI